MRVIQINSLVIPTRSEESVRRVCKYYTDISLRSIWQMLLNTFGPWACRRAFHSEWQSLLKIAECFWITCYRIKKIAARADFWIGVVDSNKCSSPRRQDNALMAYGHWYLYCVQVVWRGVSHSPQLSELGFIELVDDKIAGDLIIPTIILTLRVQMWIVPHGMRGGMNQLATRTLERFN